MIGPETRPHRPGFAPARRLLATLALFAPLAVAAAPAPAACTADWPLWQEFQTRFIQPEGRVLDASTPQKHTSSEGQSYGMFFALVAGDRDTFDKLWRWSVNNLFAGDATARLPAWFWGLAPDGGWHVLDANSASDADLWFTYALLEAGRAWNRPDYVAAARALLTRIEQEEVAELPGLGKMLLPGAYGFNTPDGTWRLNASYLPLPLLRRLAAEHPQGPWRDMAKNVARVYEGAGTTGWVADWIGYRRDAGDDAQAQDKGHFFVDPVKGDVGSYDAIRTYLWAGMTPPADPMFRTVQHATRSMAQAIAQTGVPPESVTVTTGTMQGAGSFGFSAALLPSLHVAKQDALQRAQRERVLVLMAGANAAADANHTQARYYDYVLSLFGLGWQEGHYRFGKDGSLNLPWEKACPRASAQ